MKLAKTVLVAIVGVVILAGCRTRTEAVLVINLPPEEARTSPNGVVEVWVLPDHYKYYGITDGKTAMKPVKLKNKDKLEPILMRDKTMLLKKGCMIKVSQSASEAKLVDLLDLIGKMKVVNLNVLTLKEK